MIVISAAVLGAVAALTFADTSEGASEAATPYSVYAEHLGVNVDGLSDNGSMLVAGVGYQLTDKVTVNLDYGRTISKPETTLNVPSIMDGAQQTRWEVGLEQYRAFAQRDFQFGSSSFGAHVRLGVSHLDADVEVSTDTDSGRGEVGGTDLLIGGGIIWKAHPRHHVTGEVAIANRDVATGGIGYRFRF